MMNAGNPKIFKLDNILITTSYNFKNDVRKACEELLRNYNNLDCYNIQNPIIGSAPTRVIELFGTVPVTFKGQIYHMMVSFIFPPLFPNVPPLVHFANPDYNKYKALDKYDGKKFLAPNGKYYYPLNFSEIVSWMSHKSVMRIAMQIIKEFSAEYPIYSVTSSQQQQQQQKPILFPQQQQQQQGMYQNPMQQYGQQQQQQGYGQQQGGYNPTNQFNPIQQYQMPTQIHTNQQQGQPTNIYTYQQNSPQMNVSSPLNESIAKTLEKRYKEEAIEIAKKLEKDLNVQRNHMVEIQNLHLKLQEEEEKLQKFEANVPLITSELESKIQGLDQIISTHQGTVLSMETLGTVVGEEDEGSKMLMDLMTTNKAIEDLNLLVEELFNSGRIDLEVYLKIFKDNTEREFLNNVLMKKILTEKQGQRA